MEGIGWKKRRKVQDGWIEEVTQDGMVKLKGFSRKLLKGHDKKWLW